jgi:flagellar biosynthesis protein FliR
VLFIGLAVKNLLGLAMLIAALSYWPHSFSQRFAESVALAERLLHLSH